MKKFKDKIQLTKPFIPPKDDFQAYLDQIWENRILTNEGPIHQQFEQALQKKLGVENISLFSNGSLALMLALKSLDLKGEVITTPFSWIATAQAIHWNNLTPVFVDIDEDLNIDVEQIEKAITPETSAILAVHVFGNPCQVEQIEKIAKKHKLKIIYDAAHCYGVEINTTSVCNYGDLSILSFHATKVFNTIEGGAVVCKNKETKKLLDSLKDACLADSSLLAGLGINAKMNELQAAFGLSQLKYMDDVISRRAEISGIYTSHLKGIQGIKLPPFSKVAKSNYSYLPIIVDPLRFGATRDQLYDLLLEQNVVTRKYFHPLLYNFDAYAAYKMNDCSIAEQISNNILCLPLYHDLTTDEVLHVVDQIEQIQKQAELVVMQEIV